MDRPAFANVDIIPLEEVATLDALFGARVARSGDAVAYREYDPQKGAWQDHTWAQMNAEVARWQAAMERDGLQPGDRVAVMLPNGTAWVKFDQAALGLGLVVVPLYTSDRPDNVAYVVRDSGAKLLLFDSVDQWQALSGIKDQFKDVVWLLCLRPFKGEAEDPRLVAVSDWLPDGAGPTKHLPTDPDALATIVYTSGTTGRPKGVMLSHRNILSNAAACLKTMEVTMQDLMLSFLPLSHTFERTVGYYLPIMSGTPVAYARSVQQLSEDFRLVRPTLIITVPRIFERVYAAIRQKLSQSPALRRKLFELAVDIGCARFEHAQGRGPLHPMNFLWPVLKRLVADKVLDRLGGRVRAAICGGAALSPEISRLFIGLGLPVLQGYGLTEASPVVTTNRLENNVPASVGLPLPGVEVRLGEKNALLVRGPNVMLGYWNNKEATRAILSDDGWLNTGDTARFDEAGRVYITGRLKDIIVLSTGEKVPPVDMEAAILRDCLFEQVMVFGEGRPYLCVLAVLNPDHWRQLACEVGLNPDSETDLRSRTVEEIVLRRIARQVKDFPGYAQIRRAAVFLEAWTVENGMLTPTMKVRRAKVLEQYQDIVATLYKGH
ncbi:AMP-dependent synthetase/ligase [Pelomicrobium methylotrophicum]|uniref:Long-chain fatty acid--CoA ligase n=1 Tax=Pelomicrobium methylotrophicum TaxID=2602750 RepID=A0A5C7EIM6_9PROT|nr:long-chain fatty acid--CoA ligase [Pelomicrobium methylotrophicum]TXF11259.1 long-chain fatty acid--CoA ligase [Pelomicrobium methylotrophicum]